MSNLRKIRENKAPDNRQIIKFPLPIDSSCSFYSTQIDFSDAVKELCLKNQEILNLTLGVCKIIVLGDPYVGKTSIVNRFCCNLFDSNYKSTIGVDFQVERFDILGIPYTLQIWDTAGQERFKSIAQSYYRGAHVIVIVFDLSSIKTLFKCKTWLQEASNAAGSSTPYIFLVGTKKDLQSEKAYLNTELIAQDYAKKLSAEYWYVSAKTGENIEGLFKRIAALNFNKCVTASINNLDIGEKDVIIGNDLVALAKDKNKGKRKGCSHKCSS